MRNQWIAAVFLAILAFAGSGLAPPPADAGAITNVAAGQTCAMFQSVCAKRCKARAPDDPDCVSDHCTPKLMQCRKDGCWQEGNLYGGKRTCGLTRT